MQLRAPSEKPLFLKPIHTNAGIEAAYRKKLMKLVDEMQESIVYWLEAAYKANPPAMAADEAPSIVLRRAMRKLSRRWVRRFDDMAGKMADYFATAISERVDGAMQQMLRDARFSIPFTMTPEIRDVTQASIAENVTLIKSIAQQHLAEVDGLVMRAVASGHDLGALSKALQQRYAITKRRAALIARDQSSKATATITRARQASLGITTAIWLHSRGGKEPRPEHVKFDGKPYDIAKGMWSEVEGKYIWPGTEINCRCLSRPVVPGFEG